MSRLHILQAEKDNLTSSCDRDEVKHCVRAYALRRMHTGQCLGGGVVLGEESFSDSNQEIDFGFVHVEH